MSGAIQLASEAAMRYRPAHLLGNQHATLSTRTNGEDVKLAIFGENRGPQHRALVEALLRSWRPERVVVLLRQGLGKVAHDQAIAMGIPVLRFGHVRRTVAGGQRRSPRGTRLRGATVFKGCIELAVRQAAAFGKPDLVVCIAPRRAAAHRRGRKHHEEMLQAFRACGIRCIVGRFDKARRVAWSPV